MNLVDVFIIIGIAVCILIGVYKGFLHSLLGIGAFLVSWLLSVILGPLVARSINKSYDLLNTLSIYIEGADSLGSIDNAKIPVNGLSDIKLDSIIDNANIPQPFPQLIKLNIKSQAFESAGMKTLGDYTNQTLSIVLINILAFFIIFIIARIVLQFFINGYDSTWNLPIINQYDSLLGGSFGLINGILFLFVIFILVPTFLAIQPTKIIQQYLDSSLLGGFFYKSNFLLNSMRGVL